MIFKYSLTISGDKFNPHHIFERIVGSFIIDSFFTATDKIFQGSDKEYGYGGILFWHPKSFATEGEIDKYEDDLMEFIDNNYLLFQENKADDFEVFFEVYFDGGQCNFEIFNKERLKKLSRLGISIPVSVYVLNDEELSKWEFEVRKAWSKE